jgi:hypothetical protein
MAIGDSESDGAAVAGGGDLGRTGRQRQARGWSQRLDGTGYAEGARVDMSLARYLPMVREIGKVWAKMDAGTNC